MKAFIIILLIMLIISQIALLYNTIFSDKKENKQSELEPKRVNPDFNRSRVLLEIDNPVEKVNNLIDSIIKDAIDMYNIQNPSLDKNYQYIKTSEVDNFIVPYTYVTAMKSMTPDVISIISLVYYFKPFSMDRFLDGLTTDNYIPSNKDTNTLELIIYTIIILVFTDFVTSVNS